MIFHVTKRSAWEEALKKGYYEADSLAKEGFIHMSREEQVQGVLERYYKNEKDLLLLHIDENELTSVLKYEHSPSVNELFPHLFGRLNINAVIAISDIIL